MSSGGLCRCGCGQETKLAEKTRSKLGWVKGEPIPYARGHNRLTGKPRPDRPRMATRECPACGEEFQPRRAIQKYCSLRCAGIANRNCVTYREWDYLGNFAFNSQEQRWTVFYPDGRRERLARAVMAAYLGRPLGHLEIVHHIDGNSADDRLENLQLVSHKEHYALHREEIVQARWGVAA